MRTTSPIIPQTSVVPAGSGGMQQIDTDLQLMNRAINNLNDTLKQVVQAVTGSVTPVSGGGTGASTPAGARAALGLGTAATLTASNSSDPDLASITGVVTPGDLAVFADVNGSIKDGGPVPTAATLNLGTAASKAASNNSDAMLASVTGAVTVGDMAVFADSSGSVQDGGPAPVYSTGVWTPRLLLGGGMSVTYTQNSGTYTKVGREVTCRFTITVSALGASTGAAVISGLPFVSNGDATNGGAGGLVTSYASLASISGPILLNVGPSSSQASLLSAGAAATTALTNTNFGAGSVIAGEFSYFV